MQSYFLVLSLEWYLILCMDFFRDRVGACWTETGCIRLFQSPVTHCGCVYLYIFESQYINKFFYC